MFLVQFRRCSTIPQWEMVDSLGGGDFKYLFIFTPNLGEMIHFDYYFSNGLKPPTSYVHFEIFYGQRLCSSMELFGI